MLLTWTCAVFAKQTGMFKVCLLFLLVSFLVPTFSYAFTVANAKYIFG